MGSLLEMQISRPSGSGMGQEAAALFPSSLGWVGVGCTENSQSWGQLLQNDGGRERKGKGCHSLRDRKGGSPGFGDPVLGM